MSFWKALKETFFGRPLSVQFEQLLVEDEARKQQDALNHVPVEVLVDIVKEEIVAKKKTTAKPAAKSAPANKNTKPAAKPAAKGKKK